MEPDLIRQFFLKANPNPGRVGCPDSTVLKKIADNTLPPEHPARLHLASCSPCFSEFRELKEARFPIASALPESKLPIKKSALGSRAFVSAVTAACMVVLLSGGVLLHRFRGAESTAQISKTVDLFDVGTLRGAGTSQLTESPELPTKPVKLRVVLPRFSESGRYKIGIAKDRSGKNIVASMAQQSIAEKNREIVPVLLDLRSVPPGTYLLLTTRNDDQASYYYPVKVVSR